VAKLKTVIRLAPLGAILALACAPSALAAGGPAVTVRVEGKTKTLLAPKVVHVRAGWLTRDGAKKGECPARSGAGALDQATHHRWGGKFYTSFSDFLISSILGESYGSSTTWYWDIFVDHVTATTGACEIKVHRGEQLLFAGVRVRDSADYPLDLKVSSRHVSAGQTVTVTVEYWDAKGKGRPLAGALVRGAGAKALRTDAHGVVRFKAGAPGALVLTADHAEVHKGEHWLGYVRSAPVRVRVSP